MSEHFGYDYSILKVLNTSYNVIETFNLPLCHILGKVRSYEFVNTQHELMTNEIVNINRGQRLKWICNYNDVANKALVTQIKDIIGYATDEFNNRGKKYLYLIPHSDRPYIGYFVFISNSNIDFKLLEASDITEGYELPILEFTCTKIIDIRDSFVEFPSNPDLWIKTTEAVTGGYVSGSSAYIGDYEGQTLTKLIDMSGNFRNMTQTDGGDYPLWLPNELNGYPIIYSPNVVGGSAMYVEYDWTAPFTLYIVLRLDNWVTGKYIFDAWNQYKAGIKLRTGTPAFTFSFDNATFLSDNSNLTVASFKILQANGYNDAVSFLTQINNTTAVTGSAGTAAANMFGVVIGASGDTVGNYSDLSYAELILFPTDHTSTEQTTIRDYLSKKYFQTTY